MSIKNDINGKESSKRKWAGRFFTLGYWTFILCLLVWTVSIFLPDNAVSEIPSALVDMWKWMMGFASLVILGTVLENRLNK